METLTSRKHPAVQRAAALRRGAETDGVRTVFLVEGARLAEDAARSGVAVLGCFFTAEAEEKYGRYLEPVLAVSEQSYRIAPHIAPLLSETKRPQGIFCVCAVPRPKESMPLPRLVLVLENVQDPANLGAVFRTAEALGRVGVVLAGACCDPFSPKAVRASMGAVFRLRFSVFADAAACAARLRESGHKSLAAVPVGGGPVTDIPFHTGNWAVWVGNEGNGLSAEALGLAASRVTIPMAGRAESLNAAAAAAILLWEMTRNGEGA